MENLKDKYVIKGNKLIAEFIKLTALGSTVGNFYNVGYDHNVLPPFKTYISRTNCKKDIDSGENLYFHSSWDWIMPVVEKIGDDYEFMIDTYAGVEVSKKPMQSFLWIDRDESIPLIQQTWQAVVQFIQWYNQQQLPHPTK